MNAVLIATLALLGKEIVLQPTNVVDVAATGCKSEAVLYVNGFRSASAQPANDGSVVFPSIRLHRGVTDIRVESGAESDSLSWRYGETESEVSGESPKWRENPRDAWFRDARFGLFIHWGIYSIPAKGEWGFARGVMPQDEYKALVKSFNPTNYNPAVWARLAKAAGMKYVVFTTRHHDGFCMFDSHFTDYKITNTPYGKDVLRMLVDAFRAEGLRIGFYHSLPDWTHDGYVDLETPEGIRTGKCGPYDPARHAALRELVRNHVNQLTTEYGKIDLMFFDYLSKYKAEEDYFDRAALLDICRRNQPGMLVNDRLSYFKDGDAPDYDYYTPEVAVPNRPPLVRGTLRTWETCATMNDHWGYAKDDHNFKSVETIVAGLVGCISRGGNLLLNVGPTELGEFPPESVARLRGLADWFAVNGEAVAGCGPSEYTAPFGCAYTQKGDALYLNVLVPPMGDILLPGLRGKVRSATLLRTRKTVPQTHFWGFETLRPDELRLHPQGLVAGDVIKLELVGHEDSRRVRVMNVK